MKLKDYKIAHYQLWDWLSDHPTKDKLDWLGWKDIEVGIENDCFACQYSLVDEDLGCGNCPVDKKANKQFKNEDWYFKHDCLGGAWEMWKNSTKRSECKKYAELIRDLWGGMPKEK